MQRRKHVGTRQGVEQLVGDRGGNADSKGKWMSVQDIANMHGYHRITVYGKIKQGGNKVKKKKRGREILCLVTPENEHVFDRKRARKKENFMSPQEIADKFDCTTYTIYNRLKENEDKFKTLKKGKGFLYLVTPENEHVFEKKKRGRKAKEKVVGPTGTSFYNVQIEDKVENECKLMDAKEIADEKSYSTWTIYRRLESNKDKFKTVKKGKGFLYLVTPENEHVFEKKKRGRKAKKNFMSVKDIADKFDCSTPTIYRRLESNKDKFKTVKKGKGFLYLVTPENESVFEKKKKGGRKISSSFPELNGSMSYDQMFDVFSNHFGNNAPYAFFYILENHGGELQKGQNQFSGDVLGKVLANNINTIESLIEENAANNP